MPTKTTRPHGLVTVIQLEITYPNKDTKLQYWNNNWVSGTRKLVFWTDQVGESDARLMKTKTNWRRNACMVRYSSGNDAPIAICQRGGKRGFGNREHRRERGRPTKLLLKIAESIEHKAVELEYDEKWLEATAALLFFPQEELTEEQAALLFPDMTNWRLYAALARVKRDGPPLEGILPSGPPATDSTGSICSKDGYYCDVQSDTRRTRA